MRPVVLNAIFTHIFRPDQLVNDRALLSNRGWAHVFPLYLYPNGEYPASLLDHANGRRPNLTQPFIHHRVR